MRPLRRTSRGISEVVGALMLVLIVVVAATSLAIFVAGYQKQLQSEQALTHQRYLESISVIHVVPTRLPGATNWTSLNFTIASLDILSMSVTELTLNNYAVKQFVAWELNLATGVETAITVGIGGNLTVQPRQQINIVLDLNASDVGYSFYVASFVLHTTDFVKLDLFTLLNSDFSKVYVPPTAVALVTPLQTWNGTAFVPVTVLDGTNSFQSKNSTIESWQWNITPDNTTPMPSGEKAVVTFNSSFAEHNITLLVTDSDGLIGIDTIRYP